MPAGSQCTREEQHGWQELHVGVSIPPPWKGAGNSALVGNKVRPVQTCLEQTLTSITALISNRMTGERGSEFSIWQENYHLRLASNCCFLVIEMASPLPPDTPHSGQFSE